MIYWGWVEIQVNLPILDQILCQHVLDNPCIAMCCLERKGIFISLTGRMLGAYVHRPIEKNQEMTVMRCQPASVNEKMQAVPTCTANATCRSISTQGYFELASIPAISPPTWTIHFSAWNCRVWMSCPEERISLVRFCPLKRTVSKKTLCKGNELRTQDGKLGHLYTVLCMFR